MRFFSLITLALAASAGIAAPTVKSSDDLPSREYGYVLFQYLYRWMLDADQLDTGPVSLMDAEIEVWVRPLEPEHDPDDKSVYAEVLIPSIQTEIVLKKADYLIPELGMPVRNKDFRIASINRYQEAPVPKEDYLITTYQGREVFEALYKTRNQKIFPDEETRKKLSKAVAAQTNLSEVVEIKGDQTVYLAPLSPVTNDIWVFWENERKLIRFSSDTDYDTQFYWQHHRLGVDVFDLDDNIIISPEEVPGSNAYMTKDFAGRVLFNCIVFGMRIVASEEEAQGDLKD